MPVTVRLPTPLREYAGSASSIDVDAEPGDSIGAVLRTLDRTFPGVGKRVLDEQGQIRRHVHVYVGDQRVKELTQPIAEGLDVTILAAVSGGAVW